LTIVMKFGGTSVADAAHLREVGRIVAQRLASRPAVVVSAHAGVTDQLDKLAHEAVSGRVDVAPLAEKHRAILRELGLTTEAIEPLLAELDAVLKGVSLVRELSPRTLDLIHSFGERLSARSVAAHFRASGIDAAAHDAFDVGLTTDSNCGRARPLPNAEKLIREKLRDVKGVPVITGYIGKDAAGHVTTLGRNGSDYSAAIFGNALDAEEIQIWTDVDGILSADPRLVPGARTLPRVSFAEAAELAYYGAKVLHPASIAPAVARDIPVRVLNTLKPQSAGTLVEREAGAAAAALASVASRAGVCTVRVQGRRLRVDPGFLPRVLATFESMGLVPDLVVASEVGLTLVVPESAAVERAVEALPAEARVDVARGRGILCIVGSGLRGEAGVRDRVLAALAGIGPEMVALGGAGTSVAAVFPEERLGEAGRRLHRTFFEEVPA
jgi:aspartate kinase